MFTTDAIATYGSAAAAKTNTAVGKLTRNRKTTDYGRIIKVLQQTLEAQEKRRGRQEKEVRFQEEVTNDFERLAGSLQNPKRRNAVDSLAGSSVAADIQ